jgi:hypothetical protein
MTRENVTSGLFEHYDVGGGHPIDGTTAPEIRPDGIVACASAGAPDTDAFVQSATR